MEIRESELRFTDEETDAFLERASGPRLSRDEVKTLRSLAEGWAAPLWLAANARAQFAAKLGDVWEALFAYLRQEVLATQPVDVGDFLLRTAVLNRLNPTVCRAVLAGLERGKGAAAWLDELRRRNLFLRRIEPAGPDTEPQYMYHPLFLRFLRTELQYHFSEAEIEALHRKAGQAWKQYGDLAEWLFHTQRVNDPHAARNHREQTPLAGPGRAT
jgi:LuxR family maltose regulon positive regulatory protein